WTDDDGKPVDTALDALEHFKAVYGSGSRDASRRHHFSKDFVDGLPVDLQNGHYENQPIFAVTTSPFGNSVTYIERMSGQTRPTELLDSVHRLVDMCVRALSAYAKNCPDLAKEPQELKKLLQFLDTDLRKDAEDTVLILAREYADHLGPGE